MAQPGKMLSAGIMRSIEAALERGERVELIPNKDGVRVMRVRRENLKAAGGDGGAETRTGQSR